MIEQRPHRPSSIPDAQQASPERGNGVPGLPIITPERAKPPPPENQERQPLPDVLDVLERRAQFIEDHHAGRIIGQRRLREESEKQADELKTLYVQGTDRDKLIIGIYTTMTKTRSDSMIEWTSHLRPQKTRDLIARIAPIKEDEAQLQEELRKAQEALERKTAGLRKKDQNWWRYRNLTPEERRERQREDQRESARRWRQRRKEEANAKAEQGQPIAIFPQPPTKE